MRSDGQHLSLKLKDGTVTWAAIAFRMGDCEVRESVDVVYSVMPDQRGHESLQLLIHDLAPSS